MKRTGNQLTQCLILLAMIAAGCGNDNNKQEKVTKEAADEETSESGPLAQDPAKAFQLGIDAYNQKDWKKLWRLFSDKSQWVNVTALGTVVRGRKLLARQFLHERNAFPDCQLGLDTILVNGDGFLTIKAVFRGTHRGVLSAFKPTGKAVQYDVLYLVEMKKGIAQKVFVYSNLATLLRQIGALKKDIKERATWPTKLSVVREPGKESNRSVVDTFYSLWKDGKIEEMAELFAPQAIVSDRALVKAYKTREEIIALLKSEYENHKKLRFQHEKMSAAGEYVISPATKRGVVELAVKPDAPPLAKNVAIPVLHLFKFENGKIASLDVYYDEFKLFEQFGVPAHMAMKFVNQRDLGASAGVNAKQTTDKDDTKSTDNETQKTKEKKSSGQVESIRDLNTPKE